MGLIDKANEILSLRKEIVVAKPLRVLSEKLETGKPKGFSIKKITGGEFKFEANFVFVPDEGGGGVKGIAKLSKIDEERTRIELFSKPQFSVVFSSVLLLVFFVIIPFIQKPIPLWIILIVVIMPIWFFYLLRYQEKRLFEKMNSFLKGV